MLGRLGMAGPPRTYLYISDLFRPLPYSFGQIVEAWEEDKMKPFELVKSIVEEELGEIRGVRLYGAYFDPETMTAVIEYMVEYSGEGRRGIHSVKIVHAKSPQRAIMEYYEAEKKGKLVR